jgi:DNA repair protein RadA
VTIAQTYNIAVVVTNQINTAPDSESIHQHGRIGGNAMSHAVTYSVHLLTNNQINYHAIVKSPYHPWDSKIFYIRAEGLVDGQIIAIYQVGNN